MINRRAIIKLNNQGLSFDVIAKLMNIKHAEVARTVSSYARLKNNKW